MYFQTVTGDTLLSSAKAAKAAEQAHAKHTSATEEDDSDEEADGSFTPVLAGLDVPDPVFFCTVEPPSMAHQKQLDIALECLTREDPSLRVTVDEGTGETVIAGMGELHLEIIKVNATLMIDSTIQYYMYVYVYYHLYV